MVDPNMISIPSGPVKGAASISQVKRAQGRAICLLASVVFDDMCNVRISGSRVLCQPCRSRLLAAGITGLTFDDGRQRVDVAVNESTLIDVLKRIA